jgi:hypothetical protein
MEDFTCYSAVRYVLVTCVVWAVGAGAVVCSCGMAGFNSNIGKYTRVRHALEREGKAQWVLFVKDILAFPLIPPTCYLYYFDLIKYNLPLINDPYFMNGVYPNAPPAVKLYVHPSPLPPLFFSPLSYILILILNKKKMYRCPIITSGER